MKTKTVSQLDAEGFFVGVTVADESPLEPGIFLLPAGAIDRAPPKTIEAGKRYKPWGTSWRGEAIPQPAPEPKPPEPTPEEIRRGDVIARLFEIDQQSIRPARAIAAALATVGVAPEEDAQRLTALEAEAVALRAELAGMGE